MRAIVIAIVLLSCHNCLSLSLSPSTCANITCAGNWVSSARQKRRRGGGKKKVDERLTIKKRKKKRLCTGTDLIRGCNVANYRLSPLSHFSPRVSLNGNSSPFFFFFYYFYPPLNVWSRWHCLSWCLSSLLVWFLCADVIWVFFFFFRLRCRPTYFDPSFSLFLSPLFGFGFSQIFFDGTAAESLDSFILQPCTLIHHMNRLADWLTEWLLLLYGIKRQACNHLPCKQTHCDLQRKRGDINHSPQLY